MAPAVPTGLGESERAADRALEIATEAETAFAAGHTPASLGRSRLEGDDWDARELRRIIDAVARWRGWIEPLRLERPEERLLFCLLLEVSEAGPLVRILAQRLGMRALGLTPLGDAPGFGERGVGLRRLLGGRPVNADPWRLFPGWLRDRLPVLPGEGPAKWRALAFLDSLQRAPGLWVRAVSEKPEEIWTELGALGLKPWVHRRLSAARLPWDSSVAHVPPYRLGRLEPADLGSQAVVAVADPRPGERWWVAGAGEGSKPLDIAWRMRGKGVVLASDRDSAKLKRIAGRAKALPLCNISTREWDGRHPEGKPGGWTGVIVEPAHSGIGTWRRFPARRWAGDESDSGRLVTDQTRALDAAAKGVKVGGTLVYTVATVTPEETTAAAEGFLARHENFELQPFERPLDPKAPRSAGTELLVPGATDGDAVFLAKFVRTR